MEREKLTEEKRLDLEGEMLTAVVETMEKMSLEKLVAHDITMADIHKLSLAVAMSLLACVMGDTVKESSYDKVLALVKEHALSRKAQNDHE